MSLHRNPQAGFENRLRRLAAAGVDLPPAIDQLRARLKEFQHDTAGTAVRDRLAQAVIDGETTDRDLMFAAALAEITATPPAVADLKQEIRLQVNRAIRAAYAEVAQPTYLALAAQFDTAAQALTAAAAVADVEAPAEAVVDAPDKTRKAWRAAAAAVADLNRLAAPLKDAAVLAGICPDNADADLPLMVDPGEVNRRQLWAAWEIEDAERQVERAATSTAPFTTAPPAPPSRCGRWGAVLGLGAVLRACPPAQFIDYRRPAPMVEQVRDGHKILVDPDSPDYQPAQPPRFVSPRVRPA